MVNALTLENIGKFFCGQGWYLRMGIDGKLMEKLYLDYTVVLASPPQKEPIPPPPIYDLAYI